MDFLYPIFGMSAFAGVKLLGYSTFIRYMNNENGFADNGCLIPGILRTILGVAFGVGYGLLLALPMMYAPDAFMGWVIVVYYVGMFPLRFLAWDIVMRKFHAPLRDSADGTRWRVYGTFFSYILDIPAMMGAFALGHMTIC